MILFFTGVALASRRAVPRFWVWKFSRCTYIVAVLVHSRPFVELLHIENWNNPSSRKMCFMLLCNIRTIKRLQVLKLLVHVRKMSSSNLDKAPTTLIEIFLLFSVPRGKYRDCRPSHLGHDGILLHSLVLIICLSSYRSTLYNFEIMTPR